MTLIHFIVKIRYFKFCPVQFFSCTHSIVCNCVSVWTSTHKRQHCCGQMLSATMWPSVWHHIPQQQLPETLWPTKFNAVLSNYMWPHGCISSCQAKRVLLTLYFMRLCQREQVPLPYCIGLVYSSVIVLVNKKFYELWKGI